MSTEVLGVFDDRQTAEVAEKALRDAGFTASEITIQSYNDSGDAGSTGFRQQLARGQSLIAVTASDNISEDNAIELLRHNGAVKVNEIVNRFHAESANS